MSEEKRLKCLQDIRGLNQTQKHDNECSRRVEGTGDWVLESKPYLYWKEHVGQLLWLKGMGKFPVLLGLQTVKTSH